MADKFKAGIVEETVDVAFGSGEEVVNADNFIALSEQSFAQVGTEEAAASGD